MEPQDPFHGERSGSVRDPFGHHWTIGHSIEEVAPEEMQRRYAQSMTIGGASWWKRRPQAGACATLAVGRRDTFMAVDPELLEILVCPKTKGDLELVDLPQEVRQGLVEKYREHFRDEEPVVEQGLYCEQSQLVYPIVSDIPIMLVEEALPASSVGRG